MADWLVEGLPYLPRAAQEDLAKMQPFFHPNTPHTAICRRRIRKKVELLLPVLNDQGPFWAELVTNAASWFGGGYFGHYYAGSGHWQQPPEGLPRPARVAAVLFFCDLLSFTYYQGTTFRAMVVYDACLGVAQASWSPAGEPEYTVGTFPDGKHPCCGGGQLERLVKSFGRAISFGIIAPRPPLVAIQEEEAAAAPAAGWSQQQRQQWIFARIAEARQAAPEESAAAEAQDPGDELSPLNQQLMADIRTQIAGLDPPNNNPDSAEWRRALAAVETLLKDGMMGGRRKRRQKRSRRQRKHRRKKTKRRRNRKRRKTKRRRNRKRRKTKRRR